MPYKDAHKIPWVYDDVTSQFIHAQIHSPHVCDLWQLVEQQITHLHTFTQSNPVVCITHTQRPNWDMFQQEVHINKWRNVWYF